MSSDNALLFLHAQTPLHPGSGTALGVVDLPVQRERHTQWPIIPGSSLKGVLRDCFRKGGKDQDKLFAIFGPETSDADAHAGALSLTDARILAFPVRSLKGVFAWVTCPAVLERLARDAALAGAKIPEGFPNPVKDEAACAKDSPLIVEGDVLVLEEFEFKRFAEADGPAAWLAKHAVKDEPTQKRLRSHLVMLHDDDFTHFVRHATEVCARIGLDYETKTVKKGALFYEEFLPAETLFYSVVLTSDSRKRGVVMNAHEVLANLRSTLPGVIQVGADETIGKGLCIPNLVGAEEVGDE